MPVTHTYEPTVTWTGNRGTGTSGYRDYGRDHDVTAPGKPPLAGTAEVAFRGDPDRWNPEELLVTSLSQCHMLWLLHLAADAGVVVTAYTDTPHGTMVTQGGHGRFTQVVLRPHVTVAAPEMAAALDGLHERAHAACFIANSVNFPVTHEPTVAVATGAPAAAGSDGTPRS